MYFPDRGCVHTLLTLYVYATGSADGLVDMEPDLGCHGWT